MYTVFKYASPSNKATTGPWQRFGNMIRAEPYGVLVGHDRAEVLLEWEESDRESYRCLVRVWSSSFGRSATTSTPSPPSGSDSSDIDSDILSYAVSNRKCVEFYWILSKCNEREDPLFRGCWMVDGVFPR